MLCYVVYSMYVVLYHIILYYIILYQVILYYIILCYSIAFIFVSFSATMSTAASCWRAAMPKRPEDGSLNPAPNLNVSAKPRDFLQKSHDKLLFRTMCSPVKSHLPVSECPAAARAGPAAARCSSPGLIRGMY